MASYGNTHPHGDLGSWILIIFLFMFFWPLGVLLLLRKLNSDRVARLNDGKALIIVGTLLVLFGMWQMLRMVLLFGFYRGFGAAPVFFYFGGGGVLIVLGLNMRRTSQRYRQYIAVVVNQKITDIETIAGMSGVTPQQCHNDLQTMIKKGYFHDGYIDVGTGRIVLPQPVPVQPRIPVPAYAAPGGGPTPSAGPRVVRCPGCGANNSISGAHAECEYCGGPVG